MPTSNANERLADAKKRYARMEERIKPFLPQRKKAEWVRREVWRSGGASPIKPMERPETDFSAARYR